MNPITLVTRFLALGLGLLVIGACLAIEVGLGGMIFYFQVSAALIVFGGAVCFTAFAHSPLTLLHAVADIPGTISGRKPEALERSARVFRTLSRTARLCGWIGTLLGMVAMLQNLSDPKKIGGGMSVALVSVLYGYLFSTAICIPCRDMLNERAIDLRARPASRPEAG